MTEFDGVAWANRFYGLPVTEEILDVITERLTDLTHPEPSFDDLVTAHLRNNYSYFGSIDKTLAGFVVLDNTGDNHTVVDLRGDGAVWWQDHDERDFYRRFDSLADWRSFEQELAKAGDDADEYELRKAYQSATEPPVSPRTPATNELAARYQWLVWLLAQHMRDDDGQPVQTEDELVRSAIGWLEHAFPNADAVASTLDAELPLLADDPHLAVYWLLHTSLLALHGERDRVLDALPPAGQRPALLEAFVETFGSLALDGEVPIVPGFKTRRALSIVYCARRLDGAALARRRLAALTVDPTFVPLGSSLMVHKALSDGELADGEVASTVDTWPAGSAGSAGLAPSLLRAVLDLRAGREASPHADELVRAAPSSDEGIGTVLAALTTALPLVRDVDALTGVVRVLLERDPYHRGTLRLVERAQALAGQPLFFDEDELARRQRLAEASVAVLTALLEADADRAAVLSTVDDDALRAVVAHRLLARIGDFEVGDDTRVWAIRLIIDTPDARLAVAGVAALSESGVRRLLDGVESAEHPLVGAVLRVVTDTPDPQGGGYGAEIEHSSTIEAALKALAPFAHEPSVLDPLLGLVAQPDRAVALREFFDELCNPFSKETFVLPRLSDEQAERVARTMVAAKAGHPDRRTRSTAGHQLYRFDRPAAEAYLIDALVEYGARYAGGDDDVEDLVADLYSAVRNMKTPTSRTALIERLFTERRSYWRMGNALGEIFSAHVEVEVLQALRERRDGRAAGCYAYALEQFVKQGQPPIRLLTELVTWPVPAEPVARGFVKYALVVGVAAALAAQQHELVRTAHAMLDSIAEAPLNPDSHARGRSWSNPLTGELAGQLAEVVSGKADAEKARQLAKSAARRAAGRPRRNISDRTLGLLAGATVSRRILHDRETGEVWFHDPDDGVHVFDGYDIVPPPFEVRPAGIGQMGAFLDGVTELSHRRMLWDRSANAFVEIIRFGDRLLRLGGVNNGSFDRLGLVFPDAESAVHALHRLAEHVLTTDGWRETEPWYVPERGAVVRSYYQPPQDGGYTSDRARLTLHDRGIVGDAAEFGSLDEAIAEHQRRELAILRDHNGSLSTVEWSDFNKRPEDLLVTDWIAKRIRSDARSAAWHVGALPEILSYLRDSGLGELAGFGVEVGGGVPEAEIAAFEASRAHPVPDVLREFWLRIGHARWWTPTLEMRMLRPAEMLAWRSAASALTTERTGPLDVLVGALAWDGTGLADGLPTSQAPASLGGAVPVGSARRGVLTVLADRDLGENDARVFTHVDYDDNELWWEKSLSWMLATRFLFAFAEVVQQAVPLTAVLRHGERPDPAIEWRRFELAGERFCELYHDPALRVVATRQGKLGAVGALSTKRYRDAERSVRAVAKKQAALLAAGYSPDPRSG